MYPKKVLLSVNVIQDGMEPIAKSYLVDSGKNVKRMVIVFEYRNLHYAG